MPIINLLLSSLTSWAAIFDMSVSFYHCLAVRVFIISTWMSWWHTGFWRSNCGEFWKRRSPLWVPQKPLCFEYSGIVFLGCSTMFTTILAHTYVSNLEWQNFHHKLWWWLFTFSQCASMYLYTWIQSPSAGIPDPLRRGAWVHFWTKSWIVYVGMQIAAVGVDTYLKMLLTDNFVHTDLHPGNILARMAGTAI